MGEIIIPYIASLTLFFGKELKHWIRKVHYCEGWNKFYLIFGLNRLTFFDNMGGAFSLENTLGIVSILPRIIYPSIFWKTNSNYPDFQIVKKSNPILK